MLIIGTVPAVEMKLLDVQGFHALIGRDILDRCLFAYNGSMRTFTLAY